MAQTVKHLPPMQETWVPSLGLEDPLEKEVATYSSILAWRIPWMEEPGGLQSMGSQSWTRLSNFTGPLGGPEAKLELPRHRGPGSIPGQETRSHMPQLRACTAE